MNTKVRLVLVAAFLLAPVPALADLDIVATTADLGALAEEIGGEHVEVQVLSDSRQDPHYVDPRPNFIIALNRADMLVVNGLDLEVGWLPPIQTQARNPAINVGGEGYFDASSHVALLGVPNGTVDRSSGDVHAGGNPHYTVSPQATAPVVAAMAERMAALDPGNAGHYQARGEEVSAALLSIAEAQRERFTGLSEGQRRYVAYHASLTYLADWLGLEEVTTVEPLPGVTPSPRRVAEVVQTMRRSSVGVILQEEFYPQNTSGTIAELTGAELVAIAGGARMEERQSYTGRVSALADNLFSAMTR